MVATASPPKSKASAMDLIGTMAKGGTGSKSKKPGKPQFHDPDLDGVIAEFIKHKQAAETSDALRDAAKDQIVSAAGPARLQMAVAAGAVIPSIGVNNKLTFTQQKRYSHVPEESAEAMQEAFGDDFDRYFKATLAIGLNEQSANDEAVLKKLVDTLGGEFFQQHFTVKRYLIVSEAFHNDYTTNAQVQAKAQPFFEDQSIKPFAAVLKVS